MESENAAKQRALKAAKEDHAQEKQALQQDLLAQEQKCVNYITTICNFY